MMKKTMLILAFAFSATASAGIYVDPFIGYGIGSFEQSSVDGTSTGTSIGARAGYKYLFFAGGLHYAKGSRDFNLEIGNSKFDYDYDVSEIGLFAEFTGVPLLRIWATYFLSAEINNNDSSGTAIGVGFTGLPFVSINAEYKTYDVDNSSASLNEVLLSVSLPLDF